MSRSRWGWLCAALIVALGAAYLLRGGLHPAEQAQALPTPAAAASRAAGSGAPVSVSLVAARQRNVDVIIEATGTVTALNSVDIRPQVSSVITRVHIREGQFVKAGQLLFTLDARNDEVNVTRARAQLAKDEAALADARRQLSRSRELFAQNFISQGAVDTNQTLVETQLAVVTSDRAAIEAAKVGLSYSRITAPAAGRAGAINVYVGSTVQPGGAPLVTVTQLDPIAVAFSLPQRNLADALHTLRSGGGGHVEAVLPEGRGRITGKLDFVDNVVDAGSGTVRVKARFDNHDQALWPGAFVSVRLTVRTIKDAIVVPQEAIVQAPRGRMVYIVDAAGTSVARPIELVYAAADGAVVTGVEPGDKVIVEGRQNVRPGVRVVERAATGSAGASAAGA